YELQDLFGAITPQDFEFDSTSAYAYSHWDPIDSMNITVGASADFLEGRSLDKDQVNPKFGLTWGPSPGTLLRLSAVRTVQPDTFSRQDIPPRLEPTQVAGFNQVYSGVQGETEWRYGLGFDHEISTAVYFGAEVSRRDLDIPFVTPGPPDVITESKAKELSGRAYVYWTPLPVLTVAAAYQYDKRENEGDAVFPEGIEELRTQRVPLSVRYFHPSGFSAETVATYVDQEGKFLEFLPVPPFVQITGGDSNFWVLGASISYRLPRRMGIIAATAENLLDEDFRFQDVDPENPDIIPERLISVKFTIAF
ncbi:MAG: TonB-dependent receptor, partial [Steroidobacteraceae bacterium]